MSIFCLTPLYWGWIHKAYIIQIGSREELKSYVTAEPFITTTAPWGGLVNLHTGHAFTSQMGTRLPLAGETSEVYETRLPPLFRARLCPQRRFAVGYLP
jgi:hypothetical protein